MLLPWQQEFNDSLTSRDLDRNFHTKAPNFVTRRQGGTAEATIISAIYS